MRQSGAKESMVASVASRVRIGRFLAVAVLASLPAGLVGPQACVAQLLAPAPAPASAPATAPEPVPAPEDSRRVADLTTRYRFLERYARAQDPGTPDAIVQAKVAVRETIKIEIEKPQGAPDRKQIVAQTIYAEIPADIAKEGAVLAMVRHYDAFRLNPDPGAKPSEPRPLEGLDVWYQAQAQALPLVMSLSDNRPLRENEFTIISRHIYLPALSAVLPTLPSRIGDRWKVPRAGVWALMGERPISGETVTATFHDLRTEAKGPNLVAILSVVGQANLVSGPAALNAQIQFSFAPPTAPDENGSLIVDARGAIIEVRAAQVMTIALPNSNGRLRQSQTRELVMARQRDNAVTLTVPEPRPTPNEANSWVTYVDPRKAFHFRHPQTLLVDTPTPGEAVELIREHKEGPDAVGVQVQLKTGDAAADRRNLEPETHRRMLEELWKQEHQDVLPGAAGWLPEADWKDAGMKVYRIEAALRLMVARGAPQQRRVHLDYYLVLTGRNESLVVTARTVQDPPIAFRKEAEALIKTIRLGAPGG